MPPGRPARGLLKSWVTSSAGTPASRRTAPSSRVADPRVRESSADSGSSAAGPRAAGERAGERHPLALAARERRRGASAMRRSHPESAEQVEGAPAALAARELAQRVGDVAPGAQVREQRVLLEQVPAAAPVGREVAAGRCRARSPLRSARGRAPAAAGRRRAQHVVLPAPDGPASARHSPAATSSATSELELADAGVGLNAEHARGPPSLATSFADSRIAAATRPAPPTAPARR